MAFRSARPCAPIVAALALTGGSPAIAGPPYQTDDPQPTDTGRWEIYNFVGGARSPDGLDGETGIDLNYGGFKDLQLTAVLPIGFANGRGLSTRGLRTGGGVVELAAKYKLLHQDKQGWRPDVSVFPRLFAPTTRRFGPVRANLLLPIWLEKDGGPWAVFGGGGYQINPGPGQRDFWQGGVAVTRAVNERLVLGAEVFAHTRDALDAGAFRALNFGLSYRLTQHWSALASAGPTRERGLGPGGIFYVSLKFDS